MTLPNRPYVIVVGVDYSDVSRLALQEALRIAGERGRCEVHALYVESSPHPYWPAGPDGATSQTEALARSVERLEHLVAQELAPFQESQFRRGAEPLARVTSHVRMDGPGEEIAQLAFDLSADLVVVGTHGRTGIARLLLGSVAHAVVTLAPCAVLVVRPKKFEAAAPSIEPPCPRCLQVRRESSGRELWCEQHRERHGQRHTYYQDDRNGQETNFPLTFDRN